MKPSTTSHRRTRTHRAASLRPRLEVLEARLPAGNLLSGSLPWLSLEALLLPREDKPLAAARAPGDLGHTTNSPESTASPSSSRTDALSSDWSVSAPPRADGIAEEDREALREDPGQEEWLLSAVLGADRTSAASANAVPNLSLPIPSGHQGAAWGRHASGAARAASDSFLASSGPNDSPSTGTAWTSPGRGAAEPEGGNGSFHGHARFEKIKGDPSKGHIELYEYKGFLTPVGTGTGYTYHLGDPGTAAHAYAGCLTLNNVRAGTYTVLTSWSEFYPRGKIVSGVVIQPGRQTEAHADEPIDYSGYYDRGQWDPTGATTIFQTFTATGTSITRASFQKADSISTGQVEMSIHQSNGGAVENWPLVGTVRTTPRRGYGADHWVSWNAGEVPTTPGQTYAIKLRATSGVNIQPYWSNDSFYPSGTGYRGRQSSPAGRDYYVAVFSDNDGTINTISVRTPGFNHLAD